MQIFDIDRAQYVQTIDSLSAWVCIKKQKVVWEVNMLLCSRNITYSAELYSSDRVAEFV